MVAGPPVTWRLALEPPLPGRALRHFGVASLDGFGLRGMALGIRAAGAILQYLGETQPAALKLLTRLSTYSLSEFMTLDAETRRNLELTETLRGGSVKGSLLGVLDHTVTPMGKRLMAQSVSKPLLDVERIRNRQEGVAFFHGSGLLRAELRRPEAVRRPGAAGQPGGGFDRPAARPGCRARNPGAPAGGARPAPCRKPANRRSPIEENP
jgi:hypothetical protein